ncbi:transcription factor MYB3-like [Punica granatum]|uniref:Uncharacterized protein n=2 Tax=Punica granatum TaxID=22663 RepID=A0A218VTS2_PUNGR|nr:transcription factor MYB3-like [Punica granatum]OWM63312.1 hypothetical protein CDL15_Pgr022057 [Punica granatum]PKI70057.1 hypothetical protein CRG98_009520 [Punica granatum]
MPTAPNSSSRLSKGEANRGAWTPEEDRKLAQIIEVHGPRRWKLVATKAGLNRCGKSCRLRWLNYLRPNIKRGNISDQEEDLILRLHKLLGNRWSLIAGRLPGRTDNEIKNYWNSHLSKKIKQKENHRRSMKSSQKDCSHYPNDATTGSGSIVRSDANEVANSGFAHQDDRIFDLSNEGPMNLEWMSRFLEMEESCFDFA